jgi:hypothetical protein
VSYQDDGRVLTVNADLSNMYLREPRVQSWKRHLVFDRSANTVVVSDTCGFQTASINAIWQLNTPVQPLVQGDSVVAGTLVIKPLDADAQVRVQDWHGLHAADASWTSEYLSGWKIEVTRPNAATTFAVRLRVNAASTWSPAAVRQTLSGLRQAGRLRVEVNGTRVCLRTDAAQPVRVCIYDSRGRLVRSISGQRTIEWDAATCGAGSYVAVASAGGTRVTARFAITK